MEYEKIRRDTDGHDGASSAASGAGKPYFTLEGLHTVTIGATEVPTAVLRYHRATA